MTEAAFWEAVAAWEPGAISALEGRPELALCRDSGGRTPLHLLAMTDAAGINRDPEAALPLATALLRAGIEIDAVCLPREPQEDTGDEPIRETALWFAITEGRNTPLTAWLLEHGARPEPFLRTAIREDDAELLFLLLERASQLEERHLGETPLLYACKLGHWEMARLLLEYGADPAARDSSECSAYELARRRSGPRDVLAMLKRPGPPE